MSFQASASPTFEELLDEANDKASVGLIQLTRDAGPVIQKVLNHFQLFNQTISTSPESTITQAMSNLGFSQMKLLSKTAGMNNHPNTVKTLTKVFFEALDIPVLLYNYCTTIVQLLYIYKAMSNNVVKYICRQTTWQSPRRLRTWRSRRRPVQPRLMPHTSTNTSRTPNSTIPDSRTIYIFEHVHLVIEALNS